MNGSLLTKVLSCKLSLFISLSSIITIIGITTLKYPTKGTLDTLIWPG